MGILLDYSMPTIYILAVFLKINVSKKGLNKKIVL